MARLGYQGFALRVAPFGYAWWYIDAESDNHEYALSIILFVGSVFSPHYHRAHTKQQHVLADNYCAINVALYHRKSKHWTFSEYNQQETTRTSTTFILGRNQATWRGASLVLQLDDHSTPLLHRLSTRLCQPLRGTITFTPAYHTHQPVSLHPNGQHWWWPVAPIGRIDVACTAPALAWQGSAYHDMNWGSQPLAMGFRRWNWQRATSAQHTMVHYDVEACHHGQIIPQQLAYAFTPDGPVAQPPVLEQTALQTTHWQQKRYARGTVQEQLRLEDTPFYSRSLLMLNYNNRLYRTVYESLDLQRFKRAWVQFLLKFRTQRGRRWFT